MGSLTPLEGTMGEMIVQVRVGILRVKLAQLMRLNPLEMVGILEDEGRLADGMDKIGTIRNGNEKGI
ncbi:hypothetical protein ACOSP7_022150 [Xanthoceras sorbifolium]